MLNPLMAGLNCATLTLMAAFVQVWAFNTKRRVFQRLQLRLLMVGSLEENLQRVFAKVGWPTARPSDRLGLWHHIAKSIMMPHRLCRLIVFPNVKSVVM